MLTYSLLESVTRICCLKYIWMMLDACIYIYSTTAVQLLLHVEFQLLFETHAVSIRFMAFRLRSAH